MDIIWIFLAMALLYGLPELLRKKQKKTLSYPQFPEPPRPSDQPIDNKYDAGLDGQTKYQLNVPQSNLTAESYEQMTAVAPAISLNEQPSFNSQQVITGIIWAEILAKPKTVKPYAPLHKR